MTTSKIKGSGWSKLTASGSNSVTVPNTATEAVVNVNGSNALVTYSFYLTAQMLDDERTYSSGYGWDVNPKNVCQIQCNAHVIKTTAFYNGNSDYLSTSTIEVFYR